MPPSYSNICVMPPATEMPNKRIFICCDGTTNDAIRNKNGLITNVARFTRCLKPYGDDGKLQLVYYHEGIGTLDGVKQYRDIATGQSKSRDLSASQDMLAGNDTDEYKGIYGDIEDAYHFLCLNYQTGDEIHLVGFSRGAFAVRSLACFIEDFGILLPTRLAFLVKAFKLWASQDTENLKKYANDWAQGHHLIRNVPIETCAVWDTVRALYSTPVGALIGPSKMLHFVEERVPKNLKNAFQALALHEKRAVFNPVLWDTAPNDHTNVRQTWFAGDHCDVGGGHEDSGLATISLLWILSQFKEFTAALFVDVMVLDYMTPLYVYDEGDEFYSEANVFTAGRIHGQDVWTLNFAKFAMADNEPDPRKDFLETASLQNDEPPAPRNNAGEPPDELDITTLQVYKEPTDSQTAQDRTTDARQTYAKAVTTIHFTVRLLRLRKDYTECAALEKMKTYKKTDGTIVWIEENKKLGIWEDRRTYWERYMFRQWIKRENEVYKKKGHSDMERLTAFFTPYSNDGRDLGLLASSISKSKAPVSQERPNKTTAQQESKLASRAPRKPKPRRRKSFSGSKVAPGSERGRRDSIVSVQGGELILGAEHPLLVSYTAAQNEPSTGSALAFPIPNLPPQGKRPERKKKFHSYAADDPAPW